MLKSFFLILGIRLGLRFHFTLTATRTLNPRFATNARARQKTLILARGRVCVCVYMSVLRYTRNCARTCVCASATRRRMSTSSDLLAGGSSGAEEYSGSAEAGSAYMHELRGEASVNESQTVLYAGRPWCGLLASCTKLALASAPARSLCIAQPEPPARTLNT